MIIPEPGQIVRVRNQTFLVQDVHPYSTPETTFHKVTLESLEDHRLGTPLEVIWELEVSPRVEDVIGFPDLSAWDPPERLASLLLSLKWTEASVFANDSFTAPFRGAIEIEPYQLEPVARALAMPRVSLLLADDVGLGKTVEAGLILQELLARGRVRRILILCPASLQRQWQDEMLTKFNLVFKIIDRDEILRLQREYGLHVNPWESFPRLITSMDFLKREPYLQQFLSTTENKNGGKPGISKWDLLIVDEAHNCAPSGRKDYIQDSDRTKLLRQITPHFEHRLFLTATPHNGYTESFTALLELLDPLRFTRGPRVDPRQAKLVMVRRLKRDLIPEVSNRTFPKRTIKAREVTLSPKERELFDCLEAYIEKRLRAPKDKVQRNALRFALTILKKRLLSSYAAFRNSLEVHLEHVTRPTISMTEETSSRAVVFERLAERLAEDTADDLEKQALELEALKEGSLLLGEISSEEEELLSRMWDLVSSPELPDTKLKTLFSLADNLIAQKRLIVFTEYKDTLDYLYEKLSARYGEEKVLALYGGLNLSEREKIKEAFQAPPSEHPVRILVATDAAAEGINLQNHCHHLLHYEIPWNPNRLEQRNGRIDRHGQKAEEVRIFHFVYQDHKDSEFLSTIVHKVEKMREDLGSVAAVLEEKLHERMLGRKVSPQEIERLTPRRKLEDEIRERLFDLERIRKIKAQIKTIRHEKKIYPETLCLVLDQALKLSGHPGLKKREGFEEGYLLESLPPSWGKDLLSTIRDAEGRLLTLVFRPELARDRRDVVLLHLNHPLMQKAFSAFKKAFYSLGFTGEKLHRASFVVCGSGEWAMGSREQAQAVIFLKLLASSVQGLKLHEELFSLRFSFNPGEPLVYSGEDGDFGFLLTGEHRPIPRELAREIRSSFRKSLNFIEEKIKALEKEKFRKLRKLLKEKANHEIQQVREVIRERIREIEGRLKELYKRTEIPLLFSLEELRRIDETLREDIKYLEARRRTLEEDLSKEPERIRTRYELKTVKILPVGVCFVLPKSLLS
ncbi:DISARM system SNF2-like helicase DrmD [Thermosulfurimonas sp. F29]|uniref:DISARM system SNF2-like helicase DrmD n=1 Tax=Thermosulfurimonas sp. F29 TaxID=2867247 RepID=UPI001C834BB9|nr:DISARM system SNF2-like helicase DrmD [Thermosulfurimonas sp. F29]MBX6422938.1 DISARM system SNF2-like helicase DrmD [Thermosulfurimonas sp. F29]